jgi:hypothetical protein
MCIFNLGVDKMDEDTGKDALGVVSLGRQVRELVAVRRWSFGHYSAAMDMIKPDKVKYSWFGKMCCTPLASALVQARRSLVAADTAGYVSLSSSRVFVHMITDGFPVQNRLDPNLLDEWAHWSQEREFPSKYSLQMIPQLALNLKQDYKAKVRAFMLDNIDGEDRQKGVDYFKGVNQVSRESCKREKGSTALKWVCSNQGMKTFAPENFPVVSNAATDVLDASNLSVLDMVKQQLMAACRGAGERAPTTSTMSCGATLNPSEAPTKAPTPKPTTKAPAVKPTTAEPTVKPTTQAPAAAPTGKPTAPVSGPTTQAPTVVATCGGTKDLIFVLDASNSISFPGALNNFKTRSLELARRMSRINGDNVASENFGLVTFGSVVSERIPLGRYGYAQIDAKIAELQANADQLLGCCTPTGEALQLVYDILAARSTQSRKAMVVFITDGVPFLNKPPYENYVDPAGSTPTPAPVRSVAQFRRTGDCARYPVPSGQTCSEGTYAEYYSNFVFKKAEVLQTIASLNVFLIGVPDRDGNPTLTDYFIGQKKGSDCKTSGSTSASWSCGTGCKSCSDRASGFDADCFSIMARDSKQSCPVSTNALYLPAIVSNPNNAISVGGSFNLDAVVAQLRELICPTVG